MMKMDFNIYEFHQKLVSTPSTGASTEELQAKCVELEKAILLDTSYRDELIHQNEWTQVRKQLEFIQSVAAFQVLIAPVIDEFKIMLNCTIVDTFVKRWKQTTEVSVKKLSLIQTYIDSISQFSSLSAKLPVFKEEAQCVVMCQDCRLELEVYENHLICPQCAVEQPIVCHEEVVTFKDLARINTNMKYSYIRQTHFKDTIKQFQGKQNKFIDPSVFQTLRRCIDETDLSEKDEHGKYTKLTKDHVKMMLQDNGLYKYYEDMNLIYYELTGVKCPNISEYEKQLMEDFDKLIVEYDKVISENSSYTRSNFLNSYYILYQILKKNLYPCRESDFPIIKTVDRKLEHDEIYEKCCKRLGWFFHPTV